MAIYDPVSWAYKNPITTQKVTQMIDNSVLVNEHGIFGCNMHTTGANTVEIFGGRMAIGNAWLVENAQVASLTAENNAHWEEGATQEGSATAMYVVAYQSGNGFNCKFRASAPAYSDTSSGTATGPRLYDKTGSTWYRYIGMAWNNSANAIDTGLSTMMGVRVLQVVQHVMRDPLSGNTTFNCANTSTAPLNTFGDQYLSARIHPHREGNKIQVNISMHMSADTTRDARIALFRDSESAPLICVGAYATTFNLTKYVDFVEQVNTAGDITYKVRSGPTAGNLLVNRTASLSGLDGGLAACTLTLTEIGR